MAASAKIVPCLWFASEAEEAAHFYTGIFPNSKIGRIARYGEAGFETHGQKAGTVMTVEFELDGQRFTALNGGPLFEFSEALSLQILVEDQAEIDHYWERLTAGADPKSQVCGWLKDRYGLSWQVVPRRMAGWMAGNDERSGRVMTALLKMGKLDLAALERAYQGS